MKKKKKKKYYCIINEKKRMVLYWILKEPSDNCSTNISKLQVNIEMVV